METLEAALIWRDELLAASLPRTAWLESLPRLNNERLMREYLLFLAHHPEAQHYRAGFLRLPETMT